MTDDKPIGNEEIDELKEEVEHFKKEKERVRSIVGGIGGMPTANVKIFNIVLTAVVAVSLIISLMITDERIRLGMIELAIVAVSVKLIYLIHNQSRVNHFQLWILSSIEWRLDEITRILKKDGKDAASDQ
jgi:hypothetical protein